MNQFRVHYRKLCLFLVCLATVMLVLMSQLSGNSSSIRNGTNDSLLATKPQLHRQSLSHRLDTLVRLRLSKVDAPRLSARTSIDKNVAFSRAKLFVNLTEEVRCPVCLGTDLCEDISSGFLSLTSEVPHYDALTGAMQYSGNIGVDHPVKLRVVNASVLAAIERVLCGGEEPCGVKIASSRFPYVTSMQTLSLTVLVDYLAAFDRPLHSFPILTCPTSLSLAVLEASFAKDSLNADKTTPSPAEKLHLLSALVASPSLVLQKMTEQVQLISSAPASLGACGRIWVGGRLAATPLSKMINSSWEVRAALGAQLLALQQDLLESSEEWLVFVWRWSAELLAVSEEGELMLLDTSHASLIDKSTLVLGSNGQYGEEDEFDTLGETCNKDCFTRRIQAIYTRLPKVTPMADATHKQSKVKATNSFFGKISRDKTIYNNMRPGYGDDAAVVVDKTNLAFKKGRQLMQLKFKGSSECAHEDLFAHIMYASACAFILSDKAEHRRLDYFSMYSGEQHPTTHFRGLLHSPPAAAIPELAMLLDKCVHEPGPGDRLRAAEQLKDLLADYGGVSGDEDDEDVDYEDDIHDQEAPYGKEAIGSRLEDFEKQERNTNTEQIHNRGL